MMNPQARIVEVVETSRINSVMAQAGVQPSGCVYWQAEACTPWRLSNYFANVQ
jgi:hypothetical protein